MTNAKVTKVDLSKNLKSLTEISDWFESQEEVDIEKGLEKVKEAAGLIKESKQRLKEVENEFEEIKREISEEDDKSNGEGEGPAPVLLKSL